jgi:oxazoline/thiazoline synthase
LRFKRHFRVERLAPDLVFLLSEQEKHTLTGAIYYALAPHLQSTLSAEHIANQLAASYPAAQVHYTLRRLQQQGYLTSDESDATPEMAFADATGTNPHLPPLEVVALGRIKSEVVGLIERSPDPIVDLVVIDDVLHPDFADYNRRTTRPWILLKINGPQIWVGPIFIPGESACAACLTQRVRLNRPVETFLEEQVGEKIIPPLALSHAVLLTGIGLALTELAAWHAGQTHLINRLMTYDVRMHETQWHTLVKRPQCEVCGQPEEIFKPIVLQSRPKAAISEAGHRSQQAATLYEQYRHHISPITGIVPYLARVASPEHMFVYASGYNRARSFKQWQNFRRNLRSQSAGKGTDDLQARVSALCEALERYSGLASWHEPFIHASYIHQPDAIHPVSFLLYSEHQYAQRESWNVGRPPHLQVPDRFDETKPIDWVPIWSLTEQRTKYVPMAYAYFDVPLEDDHVFCGSDSNGCAAGGSLEDAILQGFFELVERDSISLWWDNRARRPSVDLNSLSHPYIAQVQQAMMGLQREFWLLDITSDLQIPAFVCVSRAVGQATDDIVLGFGAHFDPQVATLRAITEMNQSLPAVLRDAKGNYHSQSPWEIEWWQTVTTRDDAYLAPDPTQPAKTLSDYPRLASDDLRTDVETCVGILRGQGLEMLVLDQTRADVGLPVVRVIVPGLRHFWARYAPGRLYDVPVKLGWLSAPRREDEMNPRAMFM